MLPAGVTRDGKARVEFAHEPRLGRVLAGHFLLLDRRVPVDENAFLVSVVSFHDVAGGEDEDGKREQGHHDVIEATASQDAAEWIVPFEFTIPESARASASVFVRALGAERWELRLRSRFEDEASSSMHEFQMLPAIRARSAVDARTAA